MSICPKCREEYEPGVSKCYDCGVELVDSTGDLDDPEEDKDVSVFKARSPGELAAMEEVLKRWNVPCRRAGAESRLDEGDCALIVPAAFSGKAMQVLTDIAGSGQGGGTGDDSARKTGEEPASNVPGGHASCSRSGCGGAGGAEAGPGLHDLPISVLAGMGAPAIDGLIETVLRGDAPVQKKSARALVSLGEEGFLAVMKLMKVTLEKEQMGTVNVLMATLREAEFRGSEWREFLPYLEHAKPVRVKTLEILGHLADSDAFPSVLPFLGDDDPEVRDEADNTLCLLSDEDMGFEAESPPEERGRVIDRWKEWWHTASGGD